MKIPKVFISYSHDSEQHKEWVAKLGADLRSVGIDVILDQWDLVPGQDISMFMQRGISEADHVVMVCTDQYVTKAELGNGGVGYERLIVTGAMINEIDTVKFIPVIRNNRNTNPVPLFLGPRLYIDCRVDRAYNEKLEDLARRIHGAPAIAKPPIGRNPFSPISTPARKGVMARSVEQLRTASDLDGYWYQQERTRAEAGLRRLDLAGSMELRFGLDAPLSKSQLDLMNAVRSAEIRTFGWPIGIILDGHEEYRPRPYGDGIRAEVSIIENPPSKTYDYWSLRSSGEFYLLQSLFEDERRPGELFFDTRIVRVTESLMFAEKLFCNLGVPSEATVLVRVSHRGLANRKLTAASPRRHMRPRSTLESESMKEISVELGQMAKSRASDVRTILEPLFMIFDFQKFDPRTYDELVAKFESGRIG